MRSKNKNKKKNLKNNGLAKIATLTTKSISNALSNYKKNKELEKVRLIKNYKSSRK